MEKSHNPKLSSSMSNHDRVVVWYVDKGIHSRKITLTLLARTIPANVPHCSAVHNRSSVEKIERDQSDPQELLKHVSPD